jgi:hypothetical protein
MGQMPIPPLERSLKSAHVGQVLQPTKGTYEVFVRAVWRQKRLVDVRQTLREFGVPSTKIAAIVGASGPDFAKMTLSLFDRQA